MRGMILLANQSWQDRVQGKFLVIKARDVSRNSLAKRNFTFHEMSLFERLRK
jgi:hypothetical protein